MGSGELENKYGKYPPLRSTEKSGPETTAPRLLQDQTIVFIADLFERDLNGVQLGPVLRRPIGECRNLRPIPCGAIFYDLNPFTHNHSTQLMPLVTALPEI
jgi:hypothetical protein